MAKRLPRGRYSRLRYARTERVYDSERDAVVTFWSNEEPPDIPDDVLTQSYTVKKGDVLYNVSNAFYGTPHLDWLIADANGMMRPDVEMYPGRVLQIPSAEFVRNQVMR